MLQRFGETRGVWLVCGILFGLGVAYYWPHEPVRADQADRNDKFAMISIPASPMVAGLGPAGAEAVFILDFLTGRLQGFYLNPNVPGFTQMFYRDVAADLTLNERSAATPTYAMVGGQGQVVGQGQQFGASLIYIAELTTGQLVAYAFPFTQTTQAVEPQRMVPVARAEFRKPIAQ
jgi:hypothetical protein